MHRSGVAPHSDRHRPALWMWAKTLSESPSSRARSLLGRGQLAEAAQCLGHATEPHLPVVYGLTDLFGRIRTVVGIRYQGCIRTIGGEVEPPALGVPNRGPMIIVFRAPLNLSNSTLSGNSPIVHVGSTF